MAAAGSGFEFFDFAAEEPCPNRVGQFVAEDIKPHWLGQHQKNHEPTDRARNHRHERGFSAADAADDHSHRFHRAAAKRQQ